MMVKDNFWSRLKTERSITTERVAQILNIDSSILSNYFIGFNMPDEKTIRSICEFFKIDYDQGLSEFRQVHSAYLAQHRFGNALSFDKKPSKTKQGKKKKTPWSRRINFWTNLRLEHGLTLQDVADKLQIDTEMVAGYFSGYMVPGHNELIRLCQLFNVDYDKGLSEFKYAHSIYAPLDQESIGNIPKAVEVNDTALTADKQEILKQIYGKIPYSEYSLVVKMLNEGNIDILPIVYGKVDYTTYRKLI